MVESGHMTSTI